MYMIIIRTFAIIFLILLSNTAFADSASDLHTQAAFTFAGRKMWNEAISEEQAAHNAILVKYFTWEYLRDPESDASFNDITQFIEQNPDWPDKAGLEKRAEVALMADNPSDEVLAEWFSKHPPQTNLVKIKITKNSEELKNLIRIAWVNDNYDKATEEKLLDKYHSVLRTEDHINRIDRLLWEGKEEEVKRLLKFVPADYQHLFQARLSLADEKTRAVIDVLRVPKNLKSNPGLIYERLKWRLRNDDKDGVRELLLSSPSVLPYPEKWWPIRDKQIREAIGEGDINLAEKLLERHGQKPESSSYKEVLWLKGWIELEFKNQPTKAYEIFTKLFDENETPGGKARAAYWAGRAAEKMAKTNPGHWFGEAAHYSTTFYGQLAAWELEKNDGTKASYTIHSTTNPSSDEKEDFKKHELVQLIYALAKAHQSDLAGRFINYIVQNAKSNDEILLATELGRDINRIDFGVRAAKKALQSDVVSLENGWPVITVAGNMPLEKPLILGLVRQESEFYSDAISTSGAIGLMQLLPGTAKETARKAGLSYSNESLFDPNYNMIIGSQYLNKLVDKFSGSYVLAIASYNAGPGRVQQWVGNFGRPSSDVRETIDWIEKIPTFETRNYVQHVLENIQVYRFLIANKNSIKLMISDDLVR